MDMMQWLSIESGLDSNLSHISRVLCVWSMGALSKQYLLIVLFLNHWNMITLGGVLYRNGFETYKLWIGCRENRTWDLLASPIEWIEFSSATTLIIGIEAVKKTLSPCNNNKKGYASFCMLIFIQIRI